MYLLSYIMVGVLLAVLGGTSLAQASGGDYSLEGALQNAKQCSFSLRECDLNALEYLQNSYRPGNRQILDHLIAAGRGSDAGIAQSLGVFYSGILKNEPIAFLIAVSKRP